MFPPTAYRLYNDSPPPVYFLDDTFLISALPQCFLSWCATSVRLVFVLMRNSLSGWHVLGVSQIITYFLCNLHVSSYFGEFGWAEPWPLVRGKSGAASSATEIMKFYIAHELAPTTSDSRSTMLWSSLRTWLQGGTLRSDRTQQRTQKGTIPRAYDRSGKEPAVEDEHEVQIMCQRHSSTAFSYPRLVVLGGWFYNHSPKPLVLIWAWSFVAL